jgi:hypothetical protein
MKKTITTLFLTTAAVFGFAQEQTMNATTFAQPQAHFPVDTKEAGRHSTIYMKMGVNETAEQLPRNDQNLMPGFGAGYRVAYGQHGVDISTEGNYREIRDVANERVANYSYALPKVNYLYYMTPDSDTSLYGAAGLALGGVKQTTIIAATEETVVDEVVTPAVAAHNKTQEFHGFIPNVAIGYEFNRKGDVKTFVQLDVSQPALKIVQEGSFFGPKVALSAGLGF